MFLPYFPARTRAAARQIVAFRGINYGEGAAEGELEESLGLSTRRFPCLSQRRSRERVGDYDAPDGLYARGALVVADGGRLLYDGEMVGTISPGEKRFATINTKIVIFPDKVCYDTASGTYERLEAEETVFAGDMTFTSNALTVAEGRWVDEDLGLLEEDIPSDSSILVYASVSVDKDTGALELGEAAEKTAGDLEAGDIIRFGCVDGQYKAVRSAFWQNETAWHVAVEVHSARRHEYPAFEALFRVGDAVELTGCVSCKGNEGTHIIRGLEGRTMTFSKDIFAQTGPESGTVVLGRRVPALDCLCESGNRIWGAAGDTIYASALGDPRNFFVYDGLSTDSYAVAVGTDGAFTACVPYGSAVLFFKEDCLHKVLGSEPAQYAVYTYHLPGVQAGSERSVVDMGEVLYYKGRSGVYAYAGGTPERISTCFGERRFYDAAAGTDGERYYISMRGETGEWGFYAYDPRQGIWLREDDTHAGDFAFWDGALYCLDVERGQVLRLGGEEADIPWSATLCRMDEVGHEKKGYSRLHLRCELAAGSWLKVSVSLDGGTFRQVFATHDGRARTFSIPVLPGRCDSFRIRLEGQGRCLVRSIVREFTLGSVY